MILKLRSGWQLLTLALVVAGGGTGTAAVVREFDAEDSTITMVDEGEVAPDALWLTRYRFGPGLNANRGSIQVYKGYIYVTWYQGGMDNRTTVLSRKRVGGTEWTHIKFPHRHVMFRGDKALPEDQRRGDSHNTIAIGICPKDDTVHLIYDLHAYSPRDFKHDYFNYRVSKKGGAVVPDAQWSLDLFSPKQNQLTQAAPESAYYRITYPGFRVDDDGNLSVGWRQGGTHDAERQFSTYNGEGWTTPTSWNKPGTRNRKGFYGGFKVFNNKMYACWARRSPADVDAGFLASGLYMGYSNDPNGASPWVTMSGRQYALPLKDWEPFKVADPVSPGERIGGGPTFCLTRDGAFHGIYGKIGRKGKPSITRHFYRADPTDEFSIYEGNGVIVGSFREMGGQLYLFGFEGGGPQIRVFNPGTKRWDLVFTAPGKHYRQSVRTWDGDTCYYHLIENPKHAQDDSVPMRVVSLTVTPKVKATTN